KCIKTGLDFLSARFSFWLHHYHQHQLQHFSRQVQPSQSHSGFLSNLPFSTLLILSPAGSGHIFTTFFVLCTRQL
ncbi:hypothetical protein NEUTE2DRAFT_108505, partial [Neurospora tetrasperma FGSC 2509]